ncbi:MAG: Hint domain-containing protein [Pseudomonadota bacterium]
MLELAMAHNVFLSAIYLGNFPELDTNESNTRVEGRDSLLGEHGSAASPLYHQIVLLDSDSPTGFIDRDDYTGDGTISYDVGAGNQTSGMDAHMIYDATLTYSDGGTANVELDVVQLLNGDIFFLAYDSETALGAKAIESIELNFVVAHTYGGIAQAAFDSLEFTCFATGTGIGTPDGFVPIESLVAGDLVETVDAGPQPVKWAGARRLQFPDSPDSQKPIEFKPNCLGQGLPAKRLVLSPQHRILCNRTDSAPKLEEQEAFAIAKCFQPFKGARVMKGLRRVTYHTLLFDRHHIISADGLAVESLCLGPMARAYLTPVQWLQIAAIGHDLDEGLDGAHPWQCRPVIKYQEAVRLSAERKIRAMPFAVVDRCATLPERPERYRLPCRAPDELGHLNSWPAH